jgi:hypothetical protein
MGTVTVTRDRRAPAPRLASVSVLILAKSRVESTFSNASVSEKAQRSTDFLSSEQPRLTFGTLPNPLRREEPKTRKQKLEKKKIVDNCEIRTRAVLPTSSLIRNCTFQ